MFVTVQSPTAQNPKSIKTDKVRHHRNFNWSLCLINDSSSVPDKWFQLSLIFLKEVQLFHPDLSANQIIWSISFFTFVH